MLVPDNEWIYAPHLVFDARTVLARVLDFSERVHANAYSIPSVALEIGVRVRYVSDKSHAMIGQCTFDDKGLVITLNDAIENTLYDMTALVHELGHAVMKELSIICDGKLSRLKERDAWLRGIYVAISRSLAESIVMRRATVREVASRCFVPPHIVRIRVALAILLGEFEGDKLAAEDDLRADLLALEQWFDEGRACGFNEWSVA